MVREGSFLRRLMDAKGRWKGLLTAAIVVVSSGRQNGERCTLLRTVKIKARSLGNVGVVGGAVSWRCTTRPRRNKRALALTTTTRETKDVNNTHNTHR